MEGDPGASLTVQTSSGRNPGDTHENFKLKVQILPNDQKNSGEFDVGVDFRIGNPNVNFRAAATKSYETMEEVGNPDLFDFILTKMSHLQFLSTVYVLVDNCDLQSSFLQHGLQWQPGALVVLAGRASVVFFPVGQTSDLHMVHYTSAGTFVLAALCLIFSGSNCVPVTLFEVEDLWREAQRLQYSGFLSSVPTSSWVGGLNVDQVDQTALTDCEPQGVILVTEHNAEVNARFTVLQDFNHTPSLRKEDWRRIPLNGSVSQESVLHEYIERVVAAYWEVVSTMVSNGRNDRDMTAAECQAWIQTGLTLTPFCGHRMDISLDWAVAWSLVGKWTSRTIFLPPKGK